jgi:initiation factor 1A
MLGNGRLEALCFDGEKRLAHIRGKLRKKVWINQGDIILLSLRDYQDEKGDVILKYSADEARSLKAYGELPESAKINETDTCVFFFRWTLLPVVSPYFCSSSSSSSASSASPLFIPFLSHFPHRSLP